LNGKRKDIPQEQKLSKSFVLGGGRSIKENCNVVVDRITRLFGSRHSTLTGTGHYLGLRDIF